MQTITYSVPAIHCGHCLHTIEMEVGDHPGVQAVKADLDSRRVMIHFGDPATEENIKALFEEIRYPVAA